MRPVPLRVPELVPGVDVRTLPLSALEGFVLSRIDGRAGVGDVVSLTGLGVDQVETILDKLVTLGAARWRDAVRPLTGVGIPPVTGPVPAGTLSGSPTLPPAKAAAANGASSLPPRTASRRPSHASFRPVGGAGRHPASGGPRRLMAESTISESPPDHRSIRAPSGPPSTHSRSPADASTRQGPDRVRALFEAVAESERSMPRRERRDTSGGPVPKKVEAIPPAPPSQPEFVAAMLDVDLPYDPTELMEQVDLAPARRKEVLDLYYRLDYLDHYELLGIAYDADKKEVRAAYFGLSKIFHPDTMFRKNLGSFKAKMESIFNRLTEAYDTLGKKKARDEYDGYLQATKKTQMTERALTFAAQRAEAVRVEREDAAPAPPSEPFTPDPLTPSVPPEPPRPVTAEARKLAQQILQRRLRGLGGGSVVEAPARRSFPPPSRTVRPPEGPAPGGAETDPQELLRRLTRTLKDVGAHTGTSDQLTRHIKASQAAFAQGDLAEAARHMQRAVSLAPERADLRMEYDGLSKMLSEKLASAYEEQARFEQKGNKWALAALSWVKVCEGRPGDAHAFRAAAHALLKAGGDVRGAQKYAQQAVFLAPDDIECHLLLAQLYLTLGLKLNAKRELDIASKLDPGHEMVKNLMADMKG